MPRWGIILAGGDGTRMRSMTERCFGYPYPKQYCTFCGTRSMLEHTIDRATELVDRGRVVTVVSEKHSPFFDETQLPGRVLKQPVSRDTGVGIFFPTSYIHAADHDATVFILPSDHFIHPKEAFVEQLDQMATLVESQPEIFALLGAVPTGPETDYGWIAPGDFPSWNEAQTFTNARWVTQIEEKPDGTLAAEYFKRGYLWNTMIMAVKIGTLWNWGRKTMPAIIRRLEELQQSLAAFREAGLEAYFERGLIGETFQNLPGVNFSRAFLPKVAKNSVVFPLHRVMWSDWGRPERILETLEFLDKQPTFPVSRVASF